MKFSDYEASHITPQMTLLKKLNEILKFLREYSVIGTTLYIHKLTGFTVYQGSNLYFVTPNNTNLTGKTISQIKDFLKQNIILDYYVLGGGASSEYHFNDLLCKPYSELGATGQKLYSISFDYDNNDGIQFSNVIIDGKLILDNVAITDTITEVEKI